MENIKTIVVFKQTTGDVTQASALRALKTFCFSTHRASALMVTFIFIAVLTMESLMVTYVLAKSASEESSLRGSQINNRHSADLIIQSLKRSLSTEIRQGATRQQLWAKYKRGGTHTGLSNLSANRYGMINPENGSNETVEGETGAWIEANRGDYYHLVARIQTGGTDMLTHRWVYLSDCSGPGTLTTILSGVPYPGQNSVGVDPQSGRVFFGAAANNSTAPSNLYSWHPTTGLSTLLSDQSGVGNRSLLVANDGRAFFGEGATGNDSYWTWKNGVLSTIIDGLNGAGRSCETCGTKNGQRGDTVSLMDKRTGRVYFGTQSGGDIYTWKDNALQSIHNWGPAIAKLTIAGPDEAYWVDKNIFLLNQLYHWSPSTGTQAKASLLGVNLLARDGISATSAGRVFFGVLSIGPLTAPLATWQESTGINLILDRLYSNPVGPNRFHEFASGDVFVGTDDLSGHWSPNSPNSVEALSNKPTGASALKGQQMAFADSDLSGQVYTWSPTQGLRTVASGLSYPGDNEGMIWHQNKLFFGQRKNGGSMFIWDADTQVLKTIALNNVDNPGIKGALAVDGGERLYFGSDESSGGLWSYDNHHGLMTILSGRPSPGSYSMSAQPNGGVYFGENAASGNFYYYAPKSCSNL